MTSIVAEQHEKRTIKNPHMYHEKLHIRFQAYIRGYLLRKKIADRHFYFNDHLKKIIAIQAWWRCVRQRKRYSKSLKERDRQNEVFHQNKYINTKLNKMNDADDKLNRFRKHVSFKLFASYILN